jgi:subtilase family serine protease
VFTLFRPKAPSRFALRRRLALEQLETRNLLSATTSSTIAPPLVSAASTQSDPNTAIMQPFLTILPMGGPGSAPYSPSQIANAYGFNKITFNTGSQTIQGNGAGQTIAIVDAYADPSISRDLHTFDQTFGLSDPNLIIAQPQGRPTTNANWGVEMSLDVEWAHAMAPAASILLVEARSATLTSLLGAVNWAANYQGNSSIHVAPTSVVSMSWGSGEWSSETGFDSYFTTPSGHSNVSFVASSGDSGAGVSWPSISSKVLSVGGTTLTLTSTGAYSSESGWSGSGGGYSSFVSRPTYQNGVSSNSHRSNPDVAYNADPNTGYYVYDSGYFGWLEVGGTSAGSPQWAALTAIADQGRALQGKSSLANIQADVYALPTSDFHDITTGSNGAFSAKAGYDLVTGIGSPIANLVVGGLLGSNDSGNGPFVVGGSHSSGGTANHLSVEPIGSTSTPTAPGSTSDQVPPAAAATEEAGGFGTMGPLSEQAPASGSLAESPLDQAFASLENSGWQWTPELNNASSQPTTTDHTDYLVFGLHHKDEVSDVSAATGSTTDQPTSDNSGDA